MKRLSAILLVAAMVVMLMPAMVWAADSTAGKDNLATVLGSAQDGDTVTLTESANLSTTVNQGITLIVPDTFTLTIDIGNIGTVMGSQGTIRVEAGGGLNIAGIDMVGPNGNLSLTSGSLDAKMNGGNIDITISGDATVPSGKEWTTVSTSLNNAKLNTTIASGTLTVAGKFQVANDSTVTVNGSIDVADGGWMRVGAKGTVTGSGSITNNGTVTLHSITQGAASDATLTGVQITLAGNGVAYSEFDASAFFTAADEETAGGYTVPGVEDDGGQLIQFSHKYSVPAGQVVPPVVNGPSYQIVWGVGSSTELWASPSTSNPTGSDEWASPSTSTDSNKTNPSMGGRADA